MTQVDKLSIYLIGALANPEIPHIATKLRSEGFDVFDDWWSAGPLADSYLLDYAKKRNLNYKAALQTYAAKHIFEFDKLHLDRCDTAIMVMKAGKSAHLELGYAAGRGKKTYILFDKEPSRVDIMYQFANNIFFNVEELIDELKKL